MLQMPSILFLTPLRSMLSDSSLRGAARRALLAIGRPALDFLADGLADRTLPRRIRIHIPRTISRFAASDAVPALWQRLLVEPDEVIRFKILRGLGRVVADTPEVRPNALAIADAVRALSNTGLRLACWHARMTTLGGAAPSELGALLIQFLADRQSRVVEAMFRLLGLNHTGEDFERVFRGLHGSRTDRASGRELVEAVLPPAEREAVFALMDNPINPARLARLMDSEASMSMTYEQTLEAIIRTSSGALRAIAVRRALEFRCVAAH
jgi:hypothetical protein